MPLQQSEAEEKNTNVINILVIETDVIETDVAKGENR